MSNIATERDADLTLTSGPLQLQYWYNQVQPGKETNPVVFALKIVNTSAETLRDIAIAYRIADVSSATTHARFCEAQGDILADQNVTETHRELAPGAYQYFDGRYYCLATDDGSTPKATDVITHGFDVTYTAGTKTVTRHVGVASKGLYFVQTQLSDTLQLQYWYGKVRSGKETHPVVFALKIVNISSETLRDIAITYRIADISSTNTHVRFCEPRGDILADQRVTETHDKLAAGAYQYFRGRYYCLVTDDGSTPRANDVVTHGFDVKYTAGTKAVTQHVDVAP